MPEEEKTKAKKHKKKSKQSDDLTSTASQWLTWATDSASKAIATAGENVSQAQVQPPEAVSSNAKDKDKAINQGPRKSIVGSAATKSLTPSPVKVSSPAKVLAAAKAPSLAKAGLPAPTESPASPNMVTRKPVTSPVRTSRAPQPLVPPQPVPRKSGGLFSCCMGSSMEPDLPDEVLPAAPAVLDEAATAPGAQIAQQAAAWMGGELSQLQQGFTQAIWSTEQHKPKKKKHPKPPKEGLTAAMQEGQSNKGAGSAVPTTDNGEIDFDAMDLATLEETAKRMGIDVA